MAKFPSKPTKGQPALQAIYNTVCDIIDYLPTLEVRGDNKTISVSHSSIGTTIHANKNFSVTEGGRIYQAGSGLTLSGNTFYNALSGDGVTTVINNNVISCIVTGPGGNSDHLYKYDCPDCSLWFYSNDISNYPNISANYVGINPGWLYGDAQCKAGFEAFERALLLAMSGDPRNIVIQTGPSSGIRAVGSQSVSTWFGQIWVNPAWLFGGTSCQEGYTAVISAMIKYLNTGYHDATYNTLKISGDGTLYWGQDNTGSGGGGDGDHVFKYEDPFNSLIFASNSGSNYVTPQSNIGSNYVYVNASWLAGLTDCKEGALAVQYAATSGLAALPHNATSCTLKIDSNNKLYWGEDNTGGSTPTPTPTPTPTSSGMPWPNYALLDNYSNNVSLSTDYQAGAVGGWLRVSYKGSPQTGCWGIDIDRHAVGLWNLDTVNANSIGNTWLLPIPPFSRFYVNFPSNVTQASFDGSFYNHDTLINDYGTISGYAQAAKQQLGYTSGSYNDAVYYDNEAKNNWNYYLEDPDNNQPEQPEYYYDWWNDSQNAANDAAYYRDQTSAQSVLAQEEYERLIAQGEDYEGVAYWYRDEASGYYQQAAQLALSAQAAADDAHNFYLSSCNYHGVTPQSLQNN